MFITRAALLLLFTCAIATAQTAPAQQLVWSDEFNGPAGATPDPAKWNFDLGGDGWGNNEAQTYTNSPANAFQDGKGNLVIRVIRDAHGNYTSARLQTGAPHATTHTTDLSWQYGRIEIRAKLAFTGKGIWPAFWMMGEDMSKLPWPDCGEIDIMENFGGAFHQDNINMGTAHGPGYSGMHGIGKPYTLPAGRTVYDNYHVYAIDWSRDSVVWSVDGVAYHTMTPASLPAGAKWVYNRPFFLLLNFAIGGPKTFLGMPDATATFPQDLLVDYVRVYQKSPQASSQNSSQASPEPPVALTAEQDHQRIMDLLRIKALRPGADPNHPQASNAVNYDESKVVPYTLPDPLTLNNGGKVTSPEMWWHRRRPEIVEAFDSEIYGRVPTNTPTVHWEVTATSKETNGDIPVIVKKLVGHVDNSAWPRISVDMQLSLTTPANAAGPVPVILEFGFDPAMMRQFFAQMAKRGIKPPTPGPGEIGGPGPDWQQQILAKGWGYAILIPTTVQADNGAGLTQGIIGLVNKGQPRKLDDWGALRAWAWGASRVLDYFETDKSVDARQVGIEGLSRYGKAAIVAMAYEPRFAIAFVGSSGEGGARIHRRNFGEIVENVAGTGEYHWMAGNFLKYAGPLTPGDLPVDAHELIALCAPRPVFISAGSAKAGDAWVDASGMFLAAAHAGPVYKLLGKKDLGATEMPPIETTLIDGDIAFRQHSGGHTTGPNWPTFLTFATRYLKVH